VLRFQTKRVWHHNCIVKQDFRYGHNHLVDRKLLIKLKYNNQNKYFVMFENIDELIEVNLKLLYTSKSQFMMRINFKDECGFNLKNSKGFSEILDTKGLIILEKEQGFRCDLTDFGRQIYEGGGWSKYMETVESFAKFKNVVNLDFEVKKIEQSFVRKITIASIIVVVLCFFITLLTVEIFKTS
jgi:hypothetical protein